MVLVSVLVSLAHVLFFLTSFEVNMSKLCCFLIVGLVLAVVATLHTADAMLQEMAHVREDEAFQEKKRVEFKDWSWERDIENIAAARARKELQGE